MSNINKKSDGNLHGNHSDSRKEVAILLMLLSSLSFSLMGVSVKMLSGISTFQIVFFRNFISLWIAIFFVKKSGASFKGKSENRKFLFLRAFCGLVGVIFYFYAISQLPLATSTILNKMSPFFVLIFSALFLKEKISRVQILAMIVAFTGMIVSVGFLIDGNLLPLLVGLLSAITAGVSYVTVRQLSGKEMPSTIIFWFSMISVLGMTPLMLSNYTVPSMGQWVFLILTGVFAAGGQYGLTYAYKYAPASEVSIYSYGSIIFSMIFGFLLWQDPIVFSGVIGAGLILTGGYMNFKAIKNRISR